MPKRPRVALKVNDLASSLIFYVDCLGFQLEESQPDADMAVVLDSYGDFILLAGPAVKDVKSHLDETHVVYKPGDTLDFSEEEENLDARLAALTARGLTEIQQEQTDEGDRKLTLKDPSNYTINYIQRVQRSPEETIALYVRGGDEVESALTGLTETDLDLTRAPEEWSIRQIVHHLAETDTMFLLIFESALARSGSTFIRNSYDQVHWAEALVYNQRAIEPSLALIKATRWHLAHLFQHIPSYWDRYILLKFATEESEGHKVTVGQLLDGMNWHLADHCAEIRETRRIHSR
jgi:catechol 2,3-dioxygenase-like lactoylglutathione lyase family enzyme